MKGGINVFEPVKDFKAFKESLELSSYCEGLLGLSSSENARQIEVCNRVLEGLYGKVGFSDRYDNKEQSLGLGNLKEFTNRIKKAVLKSIGYKEELRLPLAETQLNECASDLVNLLISSNDSYTAFGNPNNQKYVAAVAERMSQDFIRFDHFNTLLEAFKCELHYGISAIAVDWATDTLNQINIQGVTENPAQGVDLKLINPACLYFSRLADMRLFSERGDFCMFTESIAKSDILSQKFHESIKSEDLTEIIESSRYTTTVGAFATNSPNDFEYITEFSPYGIEHQNQQDRANYIVKTTVLIRVCPELLGFKLPELPALTKTLIRLTYLGNTMINAEVSNNGIMPIIIAPVFGNMTPADNLIPVQKFVNFLIGVKKQGDRKRIFGINFYDRNRISLNDITKAKEVDEASPWIGVGLEQGENLNSAISHFNDAPDTSGIVNDIGQMKNIMQIILPTDQSSIMSNLDRATEWQAKKALETSGKFTKLIARQLQAMLITPLKALHIQCIFDNERALPVKDQYGNEQMVSIGEFAGKGIMFAITTAMTGVDRDIKAQQMDSFLNRLIQLPAVTQEYDLTKLFDYQSSLTGHQIDFSMFKRESPIDSLPIEQKNLAYQLLQQAQLNAENQQGGEIPVDNA